jgi:hypothetical protein
VQPTRRPVAQKAQASPNQPSKVPVDEPLRATRKGGVHNSLLHKKNQPQQEQEEAEKGEEDRKAGGCAVRWRGCRH